MHEILQRENVCKTQIFHPKHFVVLYLIGRKSEMYTLKKIADTYHKQATSGGAFTLLPKVKLWEVLPAQVAYKILSRTADQIQSLFGNIIATIYNY